MESTLTATDMELRQGRITSTRIVKLYQGEALAVFNDMMGFAPPWKDSARPKWGRRLQAAIIEGAAEDQGWKEVLYPPTAISKNEPRFATSADAVADRVVAVEAKNRGGERASLYADGALEEEIVQTTWHQGVLGLKDGAICVLLGGNDLRVFPSPFDADTFEGLSEIALRFLRDHVDTGKPPPLDYSDAASDYLKARFPKDTAPVIEPTPEAADLVAHLRALKLIREGAENSEREARHRLLAIVGSSAGIAGLCTYKANKASQKTDWEAVAKALDAPADLVAQFTVTKPGPRVLRLSKE
jgi:hypothetical protein